MKQWTLGRRGGRVVSPGSTTRIIHHRAGHGVSRKVPRFQSSLGPVRYSESGKIIMLCIDHKEKTPSLRIWPDGGFFCHGCSFFGWVSEYEELAQVYNAVRGRMAEAQGQLRLFP